MAALRKTKTIKWIPPPELAPVWDAFVAKEEERLGRKHLGNRILNDALARFLLKEPKPPAIVSDCDSCLGTGKDPLAVDHTLPCPVCDGLGIVEVDPVIDDFSAAPAGPSAEQPPAPPQSDMLSGLSEADAQAVREFVEILRGDDDWLRSMAMLAVESSRRLKAPQVNERAVADAPADRRARSRG